jgi:ferredoxin/flavodoxin---NADP+ reductase
LHDVVVIGGGPAGLTAAKFCRMRRMSALVLDAGRVGGQLVSVYGDKPVHDWPGDTSILGNALADKLIEHARRLGVELVGNQKVIDVRRAGEGLELEAVDVVTNERHVYPAASVIVAIGAGAFEPRRLKVPGEEGLSEDALTYRMPDRARVPGRQVVVVGGGDSGLESAQAAHEAGANVTMVQVLERFTGMESNIEKVQEYGIPVHFNTRVRALDTDDGRVRAVTVQTRGAPAPMTLPCDYLVVNIGAAVNLDAVQRWGIEVEGSQIKVDAAMRTSVPGVFACGDIVTYDSKYKLLITAASEGAVAANSAYVYVRKPPRLTMGELYT